MRIIAVFNGTPRLFITALITSGQNRVFSLRNEPGHAGLAHFPFCRFSQLNTAVGDIKSEI